MQCPHCDEIAQYQIEGPHDYVCPNGHASILADEPHEVLHPQPYKPVTRDELVTFLDESEDTLTREEVREAILAAWDIAMAVVAFSSDQKIVPPHPRSRNVQRFLAVTR